MVFYLMQKNVKYSVMVSMRKCVIAIRCRQRCWRPCHYHAFFWFRSVFTVYDVPNIHCNNSSFSLFFYMNTFLWLCLVLVSRIMNMNNSLRISQSRSGYFVYVLCFGPNYCFSNSMWIRKNKHEEYHLVREHCLMRRLCCLHKSCIIVWVFQFYAVLFVYRILSSGKSCLAQMLKQRSKKTLTGTCSIVRNVWTLTKISY